MALHSKIGCALHTSKYVLTPMLPPACRELAAAKQAKSTAAIKRLAAASAVLESELVGFRLRQEAVRLGNMGLAREGALGVREVWEEGQAFRDLAARQAVLSEAREQIEAARKVTEGRNAPQLHVPVWFSKRSAARQMIGWQRRRRWKVKWVQDRSILLICCGALHFSESFWGFRLSGASCHRPSTLCRPRRPGVARRQNALDPLAHRSGTTYHRRSMSRGTKSSRCLAVHGLSENLAVLLWAATLAQRCMQARKPNEAWTTV